jgi:hypothetical protein
MTRAYVPTTLDGLARAHQDGTLDPANSAQGELSAHAVTGAVREWYVQGNLEELEYSALIDAAEASLGLLALEPKAPRRRVVVAVDVPEAVVSPSGAHRSSVRITGPVTLSQVVSVHVDEVSSEATVAAAVSAAGAAQEGDEEARFLLDEAEACDLLWYDISEIDDLIG